MLFNSFEYFVFLVTCLTVSCLLRRFLRLRTWFILLASFYFYYSNNRWQILLLLLAVTVDYFVCLAMQDERSKARRRALLCVSLTSNLGLLFFFKYVNFFGESISSAAALVGFKLDWVDLNVLLPVGISFYTFEALSYTIDVYRGVIPAERKWSRIAFLVSFFPHLIAGPIVRAKTFFPQIGQSFQLTREHLERGLFLIASGLFKKMLLADTLALFADHAFEHVGTIDSFTAWIGVYSFAFQIYFDFSGYTDIARGSAVLFGYELPENFRRPYVAMSITEFWRRWHITLSTWLRDYLYISLGGNRTRAKWGTYRNLMLTMFLGGLWHGAAWHFALWGAMHGLLLSIERALGIRAPVYTGDAPAPIGVRRRLIGGAAIFQVVTFLWIPFRAQSLGDAWAILARMFAFESSVQITNGAAVAVCVIFLAWFWQATTEFAAVEQRLLRTWLPFKAAAYACLAVGVLIASSAAPRAFIYFQF
ncbi:MAG: MBOAT family protein [Hyphomicrobiales bacterium]|nr:MBOAT family protein [Hyphomicrobiales bacterium]